MNVTPTPNNDNELERGRPDGRSCGNDFVCSLQCILFQTFLQTPHAHTSLTSHECNLPTHPHPLPPAQVSMAALELVGQLAGALRSRISLSLNTLVPALAAGLGAGNDKIRGAALAATDALLSTVDPAMLVQHFSHVVGNGTIQRGKPLLVDKLVAIAGALYGSKPQLVARYAVPAAFALLNDSKGGEAKAAANALLGALARLMGPALLDQAGGLNAVAQQRVADAVAAASGQAPAGGAELRRGGSFGRDREAGGGADRPWAPRR